MLVPPNHVPSSLTRKLTQLDQDMKDILDKADLGDYEKAQLYSDALERYLAVKRQIEKPQPIPILEERKPTTNHQLNLGILPRQYRTRAENLLSHLTKNTNFRWNDRGEMMKNGQFIPGSNVIDLIDDIVRPRKQPPPIGSSAFVQELKQANVPMTLIGNKTRFEGHEGFITPSHSPKQSQSQSSSNRKRRSIDEQLTWENLY